MTATSLDLSQIKTDALSSAATFRTLIGLGSSDAVTFKEATLTSGTVTSSTPLINATQTWNEGATTFTGIFANITDTASSSSSSLISLRVDGATKFSVDKNGHAVIKRILAYSNNPLEVDYLTTANQGGIELLRGEFGATGSATVLQSNNFLAWGNIGSGWATDLRLYRDAANTLAQRNGANAQTFNIYNTYTSSTSYERGFMQWNSNVLEIGTEAGSGGGSARNAKFAGGNSYILCQHGNDIQFFRNGFNFFTIANGLVRLFNSSLWNVKDIQLQYGYTEMLDSTPPSTPSADRCRIYAKDNGSGKTQLVVLMPDGIETVLATET